MKKSKLLFSGLLIMATMFGFAACGDDDKEYEVVIDPTVDNVTEYYIVGTVSDATGAVSGAKVESGSVSATTDVNGAYSLTVSAPNTYTVKFSASGLDSYEESVTIPAGAANRSQVNLSVKLAKAIVWDEAVTEAASETEEVTVTAPVAAGASTEAAAVVTVPAAAAPEGTTISVTTYEEAATANNTTTAEDKTEEISVSNVAIKTNPADAKAQADIKISVQNAAANDGCYFDPTEMEAYRDEVGTRVKMDTGVKVENGHYVVTIPQGSTISGKYSTKVKSQMKSSGIANGDNNAVNGSSSTIRIENPDYAAIEKEINVTVKSGWEYTTSPSAALSAAGVSTALAKDIEKAVAASEGVAGTFTTNKSLKVKIGGNYVMFYTSKQQVQTKSYTYKVVNKDGNSVSVTVTLKKYVGDTEETTYGSISKHSGGTSN